MSVCFSWKHILPINISILCFRVWGNRLSRHWKIRVRGTVQEYQSTDFLSRSLPYLPSGTRLWPCSCWVWSKKQESWWIVKFTYMEPHRSLVYQLFWLNSINLCKGGKKRIWFLSSSWIMPMTKEPLETWCLLGNKGPRKMGSEVCLCPKCSVMTPGSC